jgi:alkylhydroperoxidase family enzyme
VLGKLDAPNVFLTLAWHPGLLRAWMPFGARLLTGGTLPARERELIILRTAWRCQSEYEWGQHVRIGRAVGVTDDDLRQVASPAGDTTWNNPDAALLRATDQLVIEHRLENSVWNNLARRYDEQGLIELSMLVGHYAMVAGMLNAVGVEVEPDMESLPPLGA